MSLIFEALQELEGERAGMDSPPSSEAVEFLRLAERRTALKLETAQKAPTDESLRRPDPVEPRPHAAGSPLQAGSSSPAGLPGHQGSTSKTFNAPCGAALAVPAESPIEFPSGVRRVAAALRAALPFVQLILPLLDRDNAATASNLPTPQQPAAPAAPAPSDLARLEASLAELKTLQRELRDQVVEQNASLKRADDRLEMIREATERNTREQQELIEELRGVGKKVNFVALVALGLLGVSAVIEIALCLHIFNIWH